MQAAVMEVSPEPRPNPYQPVKITSKLIHTRTDDFHKINQYTKLGRIGKGKHGQVFLCRDDDGQEWAMKRIKRVNQQEKKMKSLKRNYQKEAERGNPVMDSAMNSIRKEIEILKNCRHPNVVRLLEVIDDAEDNKVYLIQENLAAGPVEWKVDIGEESKPLLTLAQTLRIMRDVILGLEYLHHEGIIHRDLKPYNVIYTADRRSVKLIDFGVAHYVPPSSLLPPSSSSTFRSKGKERVQPEESPIDTSLFPAADLMKRVGTPSFLAPEIVWFYDDVPSTTPTQPTSSPSHTSAPPARPPITNAIDTWSLGITFYCLLFGRVPFEAQPDQSNSIYSSEYSVYSQICKADWKVDEFMGADCVRTGGRFPQDSTRESTTIINLLDQMLQKDPTKRITLSDIKAHPWILKDINNPQEWIQLTSPPGVGKPPNASWVKNASMKFLKLMPGPR